MRLVIFGWGNVSRGDDALGPLLLARIEAEAWRDAALVEDYQLQLEHALDLDGAELALFIDAGVETPAPYDFREVFPRENLTHTSHALAPESVLDVYRRVTGQTPPPAFLLCLRGEKFELGEELSPQGAERLEAAWAFVRKLEADRHDGAWRILAAKRRPAPEK